MSYYQYWGKAENDTLKIAYCSGQNKTEIFERFKPQLAKHLKKSENLLQLSDVDKWAETEDKKIGKESWSDKQDNYAAYHLLPYHCLDVAAVGYVLLNKNPYWLKQFSKLTGIDETILKPVLIFFLALHDLGKFSESFQNIKPELLKQLQGIEKSFKHPYSKQYFGHDSIGFLLWRERVLDQISEQYQLNSKENKRWKLILTWFMQASNGHHGLPVKITNKCLSDYCNEIDTQSISEFVKEIILLFNIEALFKIDFDLKTLLKVIQKSSWFLAGFYVLCDWVGSGKQFKYQTKKESKLENYWHNTALKTAEKAIEESGLLPCKASQELLPFDSEDLGVCLLDLPKGAQLTPLQNLVHTLELDNTPQLFIIEDETGAGKTEASLILLNRLMAKELAQGFYLALPTMATADGIYPRIQKTYDKLYQDGEKPSCILAHSAAKLSEKFTDTLIYSNAHTAYATTQKYGDDAQSRCINWLADNRKKSLLAHVGVGTIDQVFLAVLKNKYQSLRLIGLIGKVLVIDEAHAYDAYMGKELEVLLEAHAALGGSAIVMSATLPFLIRKKLGYAFMRGLGEDNINLHEKDAYPLLTHISLNTVKEIPVLNNPQKPDKDVFINFLSNEDDIYNKIKESLEKNQCICWIRNSVKDARLAYTQLKKKGINAQLFHARFTLADRLAIQNDVLKSFNKESTSQQRQKRVLIATQVVEQSLDLDFDVMITDLAPIDLMLQRAGRLHRHIRDTQGNLILASVAEQKDERSQAELYIYTPEFIETPSSNWFSSFFPNAKKVYENHARLWLGLKQLHDLSEPRQLPKNIRPLIENVYGNNADIPEGLQNSDINAEGTEISERSHAGFNTIDYNLGYTMDGQVWAEDLNMPTRLGEETLVLTLAKWQDEQLSSFNPVEKHAWQQSEIRVLEKNVTEIILTETQQAAFDAIKDQFHNQGKWTNLVPMVWNNLLKLWEADIKDIKQQDTKLYYHEQQGLIYAYELTAQITDEQLETE